jgi:hypothetical protein
MNKSIAGIFLFLLSIALQAQVTIGPKVGLNVFTESFQFSGYYNGNQVISRTPKLGYQIGAVMNIQIHNNFSMRPELLFNQINNSTTFGDYNNNNTTINNTYNYLSIPINFVGTYYLGPGVFNLFIAPQFSIGLGGRYSQQSDSSATGTGTVYRQSSESGNLYAQAVPENGGGNSPNWYFNQFNMGLNYGLGYQIDHVLFTAQFHMGLTSTQPHYTDANSESNRYNIYSRNNGFTFGLAYLFGTIKR